MIIHVYDWIDEAHIPKGTKIETSRWCDVLKPRDGDETNVRSRVVVQQCNVVKRDEVYQGTPPLKVLRMLLTLAMSKDSHRQEGEWNLGRQRVRSFILRWMSTRWCGHRPGLRVKGKAVGSEQTVLWNSDGQQVFWETCCLRC